MINNNHFQSIIVIHRFHGFFIPLKSYNKAKARIIIAGDINHLKITDFTRQHNLDQLVKKFTRGLKTLDVFLTD